MGANDSIGSLPSVRHSRITFKNALTSDSFRSNTSKTPASTTAAPRCVTASSFSLLGLHPTNSSTDKTASTMSPSTKYSFKRFSIFFLHSSGLGYSKAIAVGALGVTLLLLLPLNESRPVCCMARCKELEGLFDKTSDCTRRSDDFLGLATCWKPSESCCCDVPVKGGKGISESAPPELLLLAADKFWNEPCR